MTIRLARRKDDLEPRAIDAAKFARHAAILAQSGSGKSFMLGRLVEELALHTKANFVIFDPNSDFIRLSQPDASVWNQDSLKPWFFPGESYDDFCQVWSRVPVSVASNRNLQGAKKILIDWGSLSERDMAAVMNIDMKQESDLFWCLFLTGQISSEVWRTDEETFYDFDHFQEQSETVCMYLLTGKGPKLVRENPLASNLRKTVGSQVPRRFRAIVDSLAEYQIWRSRGDGETDVKNLIPGLEEAPRVLVVDLQSLNTEEERIAIVSRIMDAIWLKARNDLWEALRDFDSPDSRIPMFIVIDEAHNLVPAEKETPGIQSVSARIVRVAAEGRKYGLHLIVATQRPRRIDASVLTEADNLVVMKMTSDSDLEYAENIFGFVSNASLTRAKSFGTGDLLMAGHFFPGDQVLHASPRRTIQGGRGIPDGNWIIKEGD